MLNEWLFKYKNNKNNNGNKNHYYLTGNILRNLHLLPHLNLTITLQSTLSHFRDEKTYMAAYSFAHHQVLCNK
jgi:hypothetical protein